MIGLLAGCSVPDADEGSRESISLPEALGASESAEGFARADHVREFVFPEDHGPHPSFRTEWWYLTGHLSTGSGQRYGYQFTLFRSAMNPNDDMPDEDGPDEDGPDEDTPGGEASDRSPWSTNQLFMAHLGLTDVEAGRFYSAERFARGAVGLAGVEVAPFAAWLENWSLRSLSEDSLFPARLVAKHEESEYGEVEIDLLVEPGKPIVLHGEEGLSRKSGLDSRTASYYYSFTRLPTQGTVRIGGSDTPAVQVEGTTWMDREWTTSVLSDDHVGWDWFSLQFSDGRDLMLFRLRTHDGSPDPYLGVTEVQPDGSYSSLEGSDIEIEARSWWQSPSGARYPTAWTIRSARHDWDLEVEALLSDQEHRLSVAYWEGLVAVRGSADGRPVEGVGYAELTGYEHRDQESG